MKLNKLKQMLHNKLYAFKRRMRYIKNIHSIMNVKNRSKEYENLLDKIRKSGSSKLDFFGNNYSFEGGLRLQQNPGEFTALCVFLKERGPFNQMILRSLLRGDLCDLS